MGTRVSSECMFLVLMVVCVLQWIKLDVGVIRVYAVGSDRHVSSCLGSLFLLVLCDRLIGRLLSSCSL
jgi:predicted anti-sigma-YlaC factor YlaD